MRIMISAAVVPMKSALFLRKYSYNSAAGVPALMAVKAGGEKVARADVFWRVETGFQRKPDVRRSLRGCGPACARKRVYSLGG